MSYWYERITKKQVIMLLCIIPFALVSSVARNFGSFAGGIIATASRTMFDWVAVDWTFSHIELYPFVHVPLETGCLEWLGFSTCETVQFQDWLTILAQKDDLAITFKNQSGPSWSMTTTDVGPVTIQRTFLDDGITAAFGGGTLNLKQKLTMTTIGGEATLPLKTSMVGAGAPVQTRVTDILGGMAKSYRSQSLGTPIRNQLRGLTKNTFECYYIKSFEDDSLKCAVDLDCPASGCSFSATCDPMDYGHHGILLPSGSFIYELWGNWLNFAHDFPRIPWNYRKYNPETFPSDDKTITYFSQVQLPITIFNADGGFATEFMNSGLEDNPEAYPNTQVHKWVGTGIVRREEDCAGQTANPGTVGIDCGIPAEYADVGYTMGQGPGFIFASGGKGDIVKSERMSGLMFSYSKAWTMHFRIENTDKSYSYVPLFSLAVTSVDVNTDIHKRFAPECPMAGGLCPVNDWAWDVFKLQWIAYIVFIVTQLIVLVLLFTGFTCVAFCRNNDKKFEPVAPVFI